MMGVLLYAMAGEWTRQLFESLYSTGYLLGYKRKESERNGMESIALTQHARGLSCRRRRRRRCQRKKNSVRTARLT